MAPAALTNPAPPIAPAYFAAMFTGIWAVSVTPTDAAVILATVFVVKAARYGNDALVFSRPAPRRFYGRMKARSERIFGALIAAFGPRLRLERT